MDVLLIAVACGKWQVSRPAIGVERNFGGFSAIPYPVVNGGV